MVSYIFVLIFSSAARCNDERVIREKIKSKFKSPFLELVLDYTEKCPPIAMIFVPTSPQGDVTSPRGDEKIPPGGLRNELFFRTTTTANPPGGTTKKRETDTKSPREYHDNMSPPGGIKKPQYLLCDNFLALPWYSRWKTTCSFGGCS